MNAKPHDHESPKSQPGKGAPESKASNATFDHRTEQPPESGLANEARPGLGTRQEAPHAGSPEVNRAKERKSPPSGESVVQRQHSGREPNDKPLPRDPQEQKSDSWAQEAERSTGVSGHSGSS